MKREKKGEKEGGSGRNGGGKGRREGGTEGRREILIDFEIKLLAFMNTVNSDLSLTRILSVCGLGV